MKRSCDYFGCLLVGLPVVLLTLDLLELRSRPLPAVRPSSRNVPESRDFAIAAVPSLELVVEVNRLTACNIGSSPTCQNCFNSVSVRFCNSLSRRLCIRSSSNPLNHTDSLVAIGFCCCCCCCCGAGSERRPGFCAFRSLSDSCCCWSCGLPDSARKSCR